MAIFPILKKLFSDQPSKHNDNKIDIEFYDYNDLAFISSLNFTGHFAKSDLQNWVVLWRDSDSLNRVGGCREKGHGRYILYNSLENKLVLDGQIERPNAAKVSNIGAFSLEDWKFGSQLNSTFYVFSSEGEILVKRNFLANLYNSSISKDGTLAVCQTANNYDGNDGNLLTFFDLKNRCEFFSINPATGWADSYDFDTENNFLIVNHKDIGSFRYNNDGTFLDHEGYSQACLNSNRYEVVLLELQSIFDKFLDNLNTKDYLRYLKKSLLLGANEDKNWGSIAYKLQGLVYERSHNFELALESYQSALNLNPKIGLKRKIEKIKKELEKK